MAELTNLECKLGEVVGLAMAAQDATQKVIKLARDDRGSASALVTSLERMQREARRPKNVGPPLPEPSKERKRPSSTKRVRSSRRRSR